jgi:hypothetical protein
VNRVLLLLLSGLGACSSKHDLASQISRGDTAGWLMPRRVWDRVVVVPFRELYDDYAAEFPAHAARMTPPESPVARKHFAGDPLLTLDEAVTRWIVPTMFPSLVVDGLDAVFVEEDGQFYAFTGMADVIKAKLAPPCRDLISRVGPPGNCGDIMWQHVIDTLRHHAEDAQHSCSLAKALCGTPSP